MPAPVLQGKYQTIADGMIGARRVSSMKLTCALTAVILTACGSEGGTPQAGRPAIPVAVRLRPLRQPQAIRASATRLITGRVPVNLGVTD